MKRKNKKTPNVAESTAQPDIAEIKKGRRKNAEINEETMPLNMPLEEEKNEKPVDAFKPASMAGTTLEEGKNEKVGVSVEEVALLSMPVNQGEEVKSDTVEVAAEKPALLSAPVVEEEEVKTADPDEVAEAAEAAEAIDNPAEEKKDLEPVETMEKTTRINTSPAGDSNEEKIDAVKAAILLNKRKEEQKKKLSITGQDKAPLKASANEKQIIRLISCSVGNVHLIANCPGCYSETGGILFATVPHAFTGVVRSRCTDCGRTIEYFIDAIESKAWSMQAIEAHKSGITHD